MSVDIMSAIDTASGFIILAVLILAAFRGIVIGRALARGVYRNRAFWIAGVLIADALQSQVPDAPTIGNLPVFVITFFLLLCVVFVFIDSTILVTLDMDFFHRNTLRWRQGRFVAYAVFFIFATMFLYISYLGASPGYAFLLLLGFVVISAYSVVALVIGARRSADRTLRRHVMLLGLFVILFLTISFTFNYTSILPVDLLDDFLGVLYAYVLYRAVMTLSPVGHVEKDVSPTSIPEGAASTSKLIPDPLNSPHILSHGLVG
jgi:hypothetical protein